MIRSYALSDEADDSPCPAPILAPYAILEEPASLYISGVVLYLEYQGQGIGTKLLAAAMAKAKDLQQKKQGLICFEANLGTCRLQERYGYETVAAEPLVPHPYLKDTNGKALLMVAPAHK